MKADIASLLKENSYPGRGIVIGKSADGKKAVFAYFIMGRSDNSRNRVFVENSSEVTIYPFDASKVSDPRLIIYSPVRLLGKHVIVTNGDQTDTIYSYLENDGTFEQALTTREFEPDAPNYTPRISGILNFNGDKTFDYKLSILKMGDIATKRCDRLFYNYEPQNGTGHFIHTYKHDGNPIPSFEGEPVAVSVPDSIREFADGIWNALNADNKVSLYVRYTDLETGRSESRLYNKNK
ncbi:MAG TPA: IMP cyclohydrolase [Clostridia bacterium]|nr:IMP cyclohydrolase [Clostridia bacterium]